jgi:uncharacterized protein YdhG (YjbR/CyaY superfamily)
LKYRKARRLQLPSQTKRPEERNQIDTKNVSAYITTFPPDIQSILQQVREAIRAAAPDAEEVISYKMPAFRQSGIVVYFAAFKRHIGLYPPVRGDAALEQAVAPYAGEKGNLRFPLDQPMPYELITRVAALRLQQNLDKAAGAVTAITVSKA